MDNLYTRLQNELIGKDITPDKHSLGGVTEVGEIDVFWNTLRDKQRQALPRIIAHIAKDLKKVLPVEQQCIVHPDYDDDCTVCARVQGENLAIQTMAVAIDQYTTANEEKAQ